MAGGLPSINIPTGIPGVKVNLGPGGTKVNTPFGSVPINLGNKSPLPSTTPAPGIAPPAGSAPQPTTIAKTAMKPLSGSRIAVDIPGIDLGSSQVKMKQAIVKWLGLTAASVPQYGTFAGSGTNAGTEYTKTNGGYRYKSFKVLLQPGVNIPEPPAKGGTGAWVPRAMKSFSIGFPVGHKGGKRITVKKVSEFLKNCKQKGNIRGVVSPSGRQEIWAISNPGGGNPIVQ